MHNTLGFHTLVHLKTRKERLGFARLLPNFRQFFESVVRRSETHVNIPQKLNVS